jgi:hypothetical protein
MNQTTTSVCPPDTSPCSFCQSKLAGVNDHDLRYLWPILACHQCRTKCARCCNNTMTQRCAICNCYLCSDCCWMSREETHVCDACYTEQTCVCLVASRSSAAIDLLQKLDQPCCPQHLDLNHHSDQRCDTLSLYFKVWGKQLGRAPNCRTRSGEPCSQDIIERIYTQTKYITSVQLADFNKAISEQKPLKCHLSVADSFQNATEKSEGQNQNRAFSEQCECTTTFICPCTSCNRPNQLDSPKSTHSAPSHSARPPCSWWITFD